MFLNFIYLQKKRITRSKLWQRNQVINIILGVFLFVIFAELLALGYYLSDLLSELKVNYPAETIVNRGLIYYFLVIFILRFLLQELPTLEVAPLLHLPLKKRNVSLYLNVRSLFSFFNFIPFFLFLPFAIRYMAPHFGAEKALFWFLSLFLFELTSNFMLIGFKRRFTAKPAIIFALIGVVTLLFLLEKFHLFSLSVISEWYFTGIVRQPLWIALPLFTVLLFFWKNYRLNLNHLYLEDLTKDKRQGENISARFSGLESYGRTGALMLNEIRLLFRNKRSKSVLFMSPLLLLYGLFYYPNGMGHGNVSLVLIGIVVSGAFMIPYGQYIMAWESRQFDFILANNIGFYEYFKAKYYILVIPTLFVFLLSTPYLYFGSHVLWVNTALFFYNIGINALLLLFTASFNRKRMELEKGQMMNYQGIGINNFLNAIPLLLFPWLLFVVYRSLFNENTAIWFMLITGLLGLFFHRFFIRLAVKFFLKNRYKIAAGFRET